MGQEYGYQVLQSVGASIGISLDGQPMRPLGGISVDWATIAAKTGSDATYADGVIHAVGQKALRYGQVLRKITATGKWGPHDPAAADGRETVCSQETTCIVERTVLEADPNSNHPAVVVGGLVAKERLIATSTTASLAAGPTYAHLAAALPELRYPTN